MYFDELIQNYQVEDIGVNATDPVDYPDVGEKLANKIASCDYKRGILFCGTGAGMAIVANKVKGVRAVCINDPYTAERAIASNNASHIIIGTFQLIKCSLGIISLLADGFLYLM